MQTTISNTVKAIVETVSKTMKATKLVKKGGKDVEVPTGYHAGTFIVKRPDLENWSKEDLIAFSEDFVKEVKDYAPSSTWRSKMKTHKVVDGVEVELDYDLKRLDSPDGKWLCKDGVFSRNPSWRPGMRSEAQEAAYQKKVDTAVARFTELRGRKPSDEELEILMLGL